MTKVDRVAKQFRKDLQAKAKPAHWRDAPKPTVTAKPGSVVVLRSGGPLMTVAALYETVEDKVTTVMAHCQWFDEAVLFEGDFDVRTLKVE